MRRSDSFLIRQRRSAVTFDFPAQATLVEIHYAMLIVVIKIIVFTTASLPVGILKLNSCIFDVSASPKGTSVVARGKDMPMLVSTLSYWLR